LLSKEAIFSAKPGDTHFLEWTVQNQSEQQWPENVEIREEGKSHGTKVNELLQPGEQCTLRYEFTLQPDCSEPLLLIKVTLTDLAKNEQFGDVMTGICTVMHQLELQRESSNWSDKPDQEEVKLQKTNSVQKRVDLIDQMLA
jgi:hypothetical protein